MLQFSTPVEIQTSDFHIGMQTRILTIGSCFSDEVGVRMTNSGLHVCSNPFGTLYNPLSVARALEALLDWHKMELDDLVLYDGLWHSWLHHGRFSHPEREVCLQQCQQAIDEGRSALLASDVIVITFGTAWVFELAENQRVVSNCHKLPAYNFTRRRLDISEILDTWRPLLARIGNRRIIFTVSPIRHKADGMHGNQLSKATLLLAVEELLQEGIEYFPSYEIVLDELRDYRFYAADFMHPSPLAFDVIWHRFRQAYCSVATQSQMQTNQKQNKRNNHIPIHS